MILRPALSLVAFASLLTLPSFSNAGFMTYTNEASFNAAVSGGLFLTATTNFDSLAVGGKTASFATGGITFTGSTENFPGSSGMPVPLALAVNNAPPTSSPANWLGIDGGFGDFQGGSGIPGDKVTLTINPASRAVGLHIITDSSPDITTFGRLQVGSTFIDTLAGTGTVLGTPFQSYFVGIVGQLPGDVFSTASVTFTGNFFRIDDVNVYAVPEPSSMALVTLAGLVGLVRRRSRRS